MQAGRAGMGPGCQPAPRLPSALVQAGAWRGSACPGGAGLPACPPDPARPAPPGRRLAREMRQDLVMVSPRADPPVVRITEWSKASARGGGGGRRSGAAWRAPRPAAPAPPRLSRRLRTRLPDSTCLPTHPAQALCDAQKRVKAATAVVLHT